MKKVRETREVGPAPNAAGRECEEDVPLREPKVTFAKEEGHPRTAEVRRRATGGGGRDESDTETSARGRATSARRGIEDATGRIWRAHGRLLLEDGTRQDEKVTLTNGDVRRPIASRPFSSEKGRTQDAGSRPASDGSPPLYAKSSAVGPFRPAHSAKRSALRGCLNQ